MKQVSDWWLTCNERGGTPRLLVESWLGPELLAQLPVVAGSWRVEDTSETTTPGAISFTVPNTPDWRPVDPRDPLANYGQQLRASIGWARRDGSPDVVPIGSYRLAGAVPGGDTITVTGEGLLKIVQDARFLLPFSGSGSRAALVTQLLQGILPVIIDVPVATAPACHEDQDRLALLLDLVESWPARVWVDEQGTVRITEPWDDISPGDPVAVIDRVVRDGITIDQSEPGPNAYRVSTIPEGDTKAVTGTATIGAGPMAYGGPYGWRVGYYSSPLLPANRAALRDVAVRMCQRSSRRTHAITVQTPPRYELEVGDVVTPPGGGLGRITSVAHTASGSEFKIAHLGVV